MASQDIFPIFHLAREIRDIIYFHLLTPLSGYTLPNGFKLIATRLPQRHLLLLSKHFKEEYESVARKSSHLTVHDHCLGGAGYQIPRLPQEVLDVEKMKFNVACTAFRDAAGEVEFHDGWIKGLLRQMKSKRERKVAICMHMGSGIAASEYEAALMWNGCWTKDVPDLEELLVFRVGIGCTAWAFNAPKTLLLKWDKGKGAFERMVDDVDAEETKGNVGVMEARLLAWQGAVAYLFS